MAEQREYHIEEFPGPGDQRIGERTAELIKEGWHYPVIRWLQCNDGSAFFVLIMSRPRKVSKDE